MARRTLRHQLCIIAFLCIIGVEDLMTPLAVESMKAAVLLQRAELADVALGALGGCKRLRCLAVEIGPDWYIYRSKFSRKRDGNSHKRYQQGT